MKDKKFDIVEFYAKLGEAIKEIDATSFKKLLKRFDIYEFYKELNKAITENDLDKVKELLQREEVQEIKNIDGFGCPREVDYMLDIDDDDDDEYRKKIPDFNFICIKAVIQNSPLILAAKYGHLEILRILLEKIDINNPNISSVLSAAAASNNLDIVKLLLDKGVVVDRQILEQAMIINSPDMVRLLLSTGFDINSDDYLLGIAVAKGCDFKIILALLAHNAKPKYYYNIQNLEAFVLLTLARGDAEDDYWTNPNHNDFKQFQIGDYHISANEVENYIKSRFKNRTKKEVLEALFFIHNILPGADFLSILKESTGLPEVVVRNALQKKPIDKTAMAEYFSSFQGNKENTIAINKVFQEMSQVEAKSQPDIDGNMEIIKEVFLHLLEKADERNFNLYSLDPHFAPLEKKPSTRFLEYIVNGIASGEITNFELFKDGKFIKMDYQKNGQKYSDNLTLLLSQVNMTHFDIDDNAILNLHKVFFPGDDIEGLSADEVLLQSVLGYTAEMDHAEINKMMRGIPTEINLDGDLKRYFFMNLAISLYINKKYLEENHTTLDADGKELGTRALYRATEFANRSQGEVVVTDSITSTSQDMSIVNEFGLHKITISNSPFSHLNPSHHLEEREVILPKGVQARISFGTSKNPVLEITNSPDYQSPDEYLALIALEYAYQRHLSQPYKEESDPMEAEIYGVTRPNHGLAHTYRVMTLTSLVIDFFGKHAKNPDFKEFCNNISYIDKQILKMIAAFSVTGRESEETFRNNQNKCLEYKFNSAKYFVEFFKEHKEQLKHYFEKIIEQEHKQLGSNSSLIVDEALSDENLKIYQAVITEGNSEHLKSLGITDSDKLTFFSLIFYFAHSLDVMRCWDIQYFQDIIDNIWNETKSSSGAPEVDVEADIISMLNYVDRLLAATGDARQSKMKDGRVVAGEYDRDPQKFPYYSKDIINLVKLFQSFPVNAVIRGQSQSQQNDKPDLSVQHKRRLLSFAIEKGYVSIVMSLIEAQLNFLPQFLLQNLNDKIRYFLSPNHEEIVKILIFDQNQLSSLIDKDSRSQTDLERFIKQTTNNFRKIKDPKEKAPENLNEIVNEFRRVSELNFDEEEVQNLQIEYKNYLTNRINLRLRLITNGAFAELETINVEIEGFLSNKDNLEFLSANKIVDPQLVAKLRPGKSPSDSKSEGGLVSAPAMQQG